MQHQCDNAILFLEHLLCLPPTVLWHLPVEHNLMKDINPLPPSYISYWYHITSYHISFIFITYIRTGLQNPYGYGNSHIFRNQEVKATQECTTITWSSAVLGFSRLQII